MTYWLTFCLASLIALSVTPVSMKLASKWGAIAIPGGRHVHSRPIPRLGGLAMYAAFWLTVLVMNIWDEPKLLWGLFCGSTIILLVGIWDDTKGMRPLVKLLWQIAAAVVLIFFGFSMASITLPLIGPIPFGGLLALSTMGFILMLFWVVGLVNTVNISDGLDGLAAGICLMVALLLFWFANRSIYQGSATVVDAHLIAHLTIALAGAILGFLFYNFPPAHVFMGDSGSMFLGYIIGGISIIGMLKTATILGLVFPLLILGMPVTDLTFAIIRRKLRGQSIAMADRGHLHHRLLDAGLSHRHAVLTMYGISACFGMAAVLGAEGQWIWALVVLVFDFAVIIMILMRRTSKLAVLSRRHLK